MLGFCAQKKPVQGHESPVVPTGTTTPGAGSAVVAEPLKSPTPSAISTALVVSSCMSLFPVLFLIWAPDESTSKSPSMTSSPRPNFLPDFLLGSERGVEWVSKGAIWAVAVQNLEGLRILLGCGYIAAGVLVFAGGAAKWMVRGAMIGAIGLGKG